MMITEVIMVVVVVVVWSDGDNWFGVMGMIGEVVITDGGSLMCNKILHVVMPKYRSTYSNDKDEDEKRVGFYLK